MKNVCCSYSTRMNDEEYDVEKIAFGGFTPVEFQEVTSGNNVKVDNVW